jgi:hypothetical protein
VLGTGPSTTWLRSVFTCHSRVVEKPEIGKETIKRGHLLAWCLNNRLSGWSLYRSAVGAVILRLENSGLP